MNNKRYQHILFDLDGTLTDPMIGITSSVKYALSYFNIEVEDLRSLCPFIGPPLKTSFKDFYQFTDEQADVAIAKYREYFSKQGIFENTLYQGIEELLRLLTENENLLSHLKAATLRSTNSRIFPLRILFCICWRKHIRRKPFRKSGCNTICIRQHRYKNTV